LVIVLLLALAFAGAALAQDYSTPPDTGTIPSPPPDAGTIPSPPADTQQEEGTDEDSGQNVPGCVTDGQAGTFGADCQAFVVNQTARPSGWAILNSDDTHVYRFYFGAYRDPGSDDDADEEGGGEDPQVAAERNDVIVLFRTDPQDAASLSFFSADQFRNGGDPFGAATVGVNYLRGDGDDETDEDATVRNNYASWKGNLSESGTYYAVVEGASGQTGPVMYNIEVQGGGVADFTFTTEQPGEAPFEPED
jgi:hypothetical protein